VPFRPTQLGAVAVALLAPPRAWVGVATICGFVGAAAAQYALFDPSVRAHIPYGDPWATLAFGGFAVALLLFRLRAARIEREAIGTRADAEGFERFARAMLAVRDLSNTPLQTLTNLLELVRQRGPEMDDIAVRLERTVARLTELEEVTRPYEHQLRWQPGDEAWDPRAILQASGRRR
jgi:hypothetical protein